MPLASNVVGELALLPCSVAFSRALWTVAALAPIAIGAVSNRPDPAWDALLIRRNWAAGASCGVIVTCRGSIATPAALPPKLMRHWLAALSRLTTALPPELAKLALPLVAAKRAVCSWAALQFRSKLAVV